MFISEHWDADEDHKHSPVVPTTQNAQGLLMLWFPSRQSPVQMSPAGPAQWRGLEVWLLAAQALSCGSPCPPRVAVKGQTHLAPSHCR